MANWDVIVAGAGNAGLCAAHAARERGARVLVLEKADEAWSGGNSAFTAGAIRFSHGGLEDVLDIVEPDERLAATDLDPYSAEDFAPTSGWSRSAAATRRWRACWPATRRMPCAGCAARACASGSCTSGRRTRSTGASGSGAGSRSAPSTAARG